MITPSDPSEEIDPVDLKDEVEETKISHSTESDPEIDESPENQPSPLTSGKESIKGNSEIFEKKFECDQCDFTCLTHGGLYLHQKAVHLGIRFKCDQCAYEGTQEINLKRHIESKHGTIQYCCKLCSAKTRGLWYIETHLKKVHGITNKTDHFKYLTLKRVDPHKGTEKSSMSEIIDTTDNDNALTMSEVTDMTDEVDPSEMLDQSITYVSGETEEEDTLQGAENENLSDNPEPTVKVPGHICKKCGFAAQSSGSLARHVNVVHKGVRWSCKLCDYVTNVKCSMVRHIQSIHMGWRYQCPVCDHEATQKGGLKYHIEKRHPGLTPIPKWSDLEPVMSTSATLPIPGIENLRVSDMYDEVFDPADDNSPGSASLSPITNDPEENEGEEEEDDDGFMFEPTVQITEVGEELDTTVEDDLGSGDSEAKENSQYDGENHDFSELIAKFNNNGDTEIQCDLCTYVTSRIGNMKRHVSAAHQGIRYPCPLCSYRAPDKGSLMRHRRGVHEGVKFQCDFCPYSASQKGNLKKHVEMKHPDQQYLCPYCDFTVNWKGSFLKHIQNMHGDMIQEKFDSKTLNMDMTNIVKEPIEVNHRITREENETIQLPSEDKTDVKLQTVGFAEKIQLKRKYVEKDDKIVLTDELNDDDISVNLEPQECFDQESNTYICPLCDYKAHSAPSLLRHHGAVHKGIRWKCKDCDFITRDKSSLKRHRRNRHDGIRFQCNYCDYDAGQKGNIKSHMDRRHPEIPYDHTEFQQVRMGKSKFTREPRREYSTPDREELSANSPNVQILSTFLQAKRLKMETDNFSIDEQPEEGEEFIHVVNGDNFHDSYDDIAAEDSEDDIEDGQCAVPSYPSSPLSGGEEIAGSSTPIKSEGSSILLSALQSNSPTLTPRESILDMTSSPTLLQLLKCRTPPKSPSYKQRKQSPAPPDPDLEATVSCPECSYVARSQGTLFRHIQAVHRGVRFTCHLCDFVTIDKGSLKRHISGQHEGVRHKCDFCDYENAQIGNVKKHIETKHQNIVYHCPYCDLKAKHKWYLEQHVRKVHTEKVMEFDISKVSPKVDLSINVNTPVSNKLSARASMFLKMFGSHPMAQFYVPDKHKTGGGELESDLAENRDFDVPYFSEN